MNSLISGFLLGFGVSLIGKSLHLPFLTGLGILLVLSGLLIGMRETR